MPTDAKLNQLMAELPEGLLVDSDWLRRHGYSTALISQYLAAGWLEHPARRVYRRPRGQLTWQQVVISLQTLLDKALVVGGRTALELQGFAHYVSRQVREVHLYGDEKPPTWLASLEVGPAFVTHNSRRIFREEPIPRGLTSLDWNTETGSGQSRDAIHGSFRVLRHGQWEWPMTVSTPERAILELLDELPNRESFHDADKFMEGLGSLSPRRLTKLLHDCRSVKVKRLFFFFADRHGHDWRGRLEPTAFDLGSGNRELVKGGVLDRRYRITVPEDLNGLS